MISHARLVGLAVFACACVLYANALANGFAFDDLPLIVHNQAIARLDRIPRLFASDFWAPYGKAGLYRPLVTTSYALERAVFGLEPWGFHAVNVLLHAAVSLVVLGVVRRATGDRALAAAAGLLFAAHAVHTEVVASVTTGRPGLLASLFALLAVYLHLWARDATGRTQTDRRVASLVCFGLGLLAKEVAVTTLGMLVLVDWVRPQSQTRVTLSAGVEALRSRWRVYLAYVLVTIGYFGVRWAVVGALTSNRTPGFVDNPLAHLDAPWRVVNACAVAFRYLGLFVAPLDLSHDYSFAHFPLLLHAGDPGVWGVALGVVAALVAVGLAARYSPTAFLALGLFAATFSVSSNLVIPGTATMAERLLYLPSVGLCLGLAWALRSLAGILARSSRGRLRTFAVLVAAFVLANGARTVLRNRDWRSNETIRLHDVARHPENAKLQTNVGYTHLEHGRPAEALPHFERAIEIVESPERWAEPYRGRLWALIGLERLEEARALHRQVRRYVQDPLLEPALAGRARFPSVGKGTRPPH